MFLYDAAERDYRNLQVAQDFKTQEGFYDQKDLFTTLLTACILQCLSFKNMYIMYDIFRMYVY